MKKILLLGDSIREGYCQLVKADLEGRAEVVFPSENCRFTQYTYHLLQTWTHDLLGREPDSADNVAAIHWNCGHWDCERFSRIHEPLNSIETYAEMIRRIELSLETRYPKARIFFATTTPMTPIHDGAGRTTEEIRAYNAAALEALKGTRAEINDLFAVIEHEPAETFKDYCHLTPEGYRKLADVVTEKVSGAL
ncbi:MAG: SGNH/GDSL hydrolase family protein [Clostridia bacterium]|nr:SGNH/GDSL hydrolase family protein [Clostridia bacterium]